MDQENPQKSGGKKNENPKTKNPKKKLPKKSFENRNKAFFVLRQTRSKALLPWLRLCRANSEIPESQRDKEQERQDAERERERERDRKSGE
jgi:hypothetical protein